jgi:ribosome maturation protein SDO1
LVSLDDAVIARLKKNEEHFEILVDPYGAADLIEGKEVDILQVLAIDAIFSDARKGTHASEEKIKEIFETKNVKEVAKYIIIHGDIQLTTEQRHKMQDSKEKRVIDAIVRNAMDPQTKTPHPRQRIENAMKDAGVHIDPFKPVRDQVKTTIDAIRQYIPISMDKIRVSVKISAQFVGKAYNVVRRFGSIDREEWQSDGSWVGIIVIAAGMQNELYDKLNEATKGNVSTKILK